MKSRRKNTRHSQEWVHVRSWLSAGVLLYQQGNLIEVPTRTNGITIWALSRREAR